MTPNQVYNLMNALERNEVGYFYDDEQPFAVGTNAVLEINSTTEGGGKVVFCNRIGKKAGADNIYAGFVYKLGNKYYATTPPKFNPVMPSNKGIAIELTRGIVYVVGDDGKLHEFIPTATTSANGLMSSSDKNKTDNAMQRAGIGYFNGTVYPEDKTIETEIGSTTNKDGEILFCKHITNRLLGTKAGFVYRTGKIQSEYKYFNEAPHDPDNPYLLMPSTDGIAINLSDGCAYVVNSDGELKKLIPKATTSAAGLLSKEDKTKLENYATTFEENPEASDSAKGLMTPEHVNKLNESIKYVVGYFNDSLIMLDGRNIVLQPESPTNTNGEVIFCNRIGWVEQTKIPFAGFVYRVKELSKNKYYSIEAGLPSGALKNPAPFKGGIAINLTNGYTYAVQSNGELRELMSPSILNKIDALEQRISALEGN